ncbi:Slx4p interacting protein [Elasticomyces elasticus]|uniref:Slx4p interacting protein n=1 Tax=Exophiala sideris TaxID=1016849 RepID=A0ABR0JNS9_9EURO|nr:Slx4p interacting protein [Elasticomyces elasticus]KAK5038089.1 Slx4p interacting protein [Exophiala sideris]KAK5044072.1 Slx4p interacting protein [Exophiala sideris]KAK5067572.1 Slx4p interacting protein [Exophiala sideris]
MTKADLIGKGGVHGVDPTYARLRNVFEKSQFLLDEDDDQKCSKHPWTELMQQVTLRTRGLKEVQKLLKKKGKSTAVTAAEILESESEEEAEEKEALTAQDVIDEELGGEHEDEADLEDEEDDNASLASTASLFSPIAKGKAGTKQTDHQARLEIVIEDSEDER